MSVITLPNAEQLERVISLMGGDSDIYGVEWRQDIDEVVRVGGSKGLKREAFDFIYPWAGMRRCLVDDDINVIAYYGDPNYREDGLLGDEESGFTVGHQVMVEIPRFYYRSFRTPRGIQWEVSPNKKDGFGLFPAFTDGTKEFNHAYFSAYEGTLYNVEGEKYIKDDSAGDLNTLRGDLLSSVIGGRPASGDNQTFHIKNARIVANNRGEGWGIQDFTTTSAIQLLHLIEYASFDTQSTIGRGVVNKSSGTGNESEVTGGTSSLGNKSGMASGTDGLVSVSYRGIENFWGNIYKWMDGLNIRNNEPYFALGEYESDKFDGNYEYLGGRLANRNGYANDILFNEDFGFGFLATDVSGSSSSGLHDYYGQNTGNRVALVGGYWYTGLGAGGFSLRLTYSSAGSGRTVGARLLAKK